MKLPRFRNLNFETEFKVILNSYNTILYYIKRMTTTFRRHYGSAGNPVDNRYNRYKILDLTDIGAEEEPAAVEEDVILCPTCQTVFEDVELVKTKTDYKFWSGLVVPAGNYFCPKCGFVRPASDDTTVDKKGEGLGPKHIMLQRTNHGVTFKSFRYTPTTTRKPKTEVEQMLEREEQGEVNRFRAAGHLVGDSVTVTN